MRVWICAIFLLCAACTQESNPARTSTLTLKSQQERYTIKAEIADTPQARAQGLMGKTKLANGEGMLFLWPDNQHIKPQNVGFWMKNTPLPLTLVFFHDNAVIHIVRRAYPNDECVHNTSLPTQAVLELDARTEIAKKVQLGWTLDYALKAD